MGMHDVNFDPEAVDAAFGEFEQGAAAAPAGGQLVPAAADSDGWIDAARLAAGMLADGIAPNWQITREAREEWAVALAACLEDLAPGGLGNMANWGPWPKLAFASATIALAGFDLSTGKFKPLKPQPPEQAQAQAARPKAPQGFTTGGSPGTVDGEGAQ